MERARGHEYWLGIMYSFNHAGREHKGGGLGTVCYIRAIFQYDAFDVRGMDLHVFPTNPVHFAEQANC
jgi:hypothetical protein